MYLIQALKRAWSTHPIQPHTGKVLTYQATTAAMLCYYYGSLLWGYRSHIPWLSTSWNLTGNDNVNLPKLGWEGRNRNPRFLPIGCC